jgi:MFS family permease
VGGLLGQYYGFTTAFVVNVAIEVLAVPLVIGHVHEPPRHAATAEHDAPGALPTSWRALFSVPLLVVYGVFFCLQVTMGVLSALWPIWIHDLGGSYTYIGATVTVFAIPQLILGASAGRLVDRRGPAPFLAASGILAGLIYAGYAVITDLAVILLLGIVEGVVTVVQQPIAQGLLAASSPLQARGRTQGIAGTAGAIGGSIAAFAAVPLYRYSAPLPFLLLGAIVAVGSVVAAVGTLRATRPLAHSR